MKNYLPNKWDCVVCQGKQWINDVYKFRANRKDKLKLFCLFDNRPVKRYNTIHTFTYAYRHIVLEVNKSFFKKVKEWFKK